MNLEINRACKEEKQLQRSSLKCEDFHDYKVIIIAGNKNAIVIFLLDQNKFEKFCSYYLRSDKQIYYFLYYSLSILANVKFKSFQKSKKLNTF